MSATVQREKRQTRPKMPPPISLRLRPVIDLTPDQLLERASLNDDLRLELSSEGALIVMSPTSWERTRRNEAIAFQLGAWARQDGTGYAAESSGGFRLQSGATRAPDAA